MLWIVRGQAALWARILLQFCKFEGEMKDFILIGTNEDSLVRKHRAENEYCNEEGVCSIVDSLEDVFVINVAGAFMQSTKAVKKSEYFVSYIKMMHSLEKFILVSFKRRDLPLSRELSQAEKSLTNRLFSEDSSLRKDDNGLLDLLNSGKAQVVEIDDLELDEFNVQEKILPLLISQIHMDALDNQLLFVVSQCILVYGPK
eukprot:TRINITY_DN6802_c0_g1_i1.p1 TRINITY_DN6802_c0_g1~~TRINITY_DN6802_c0_g1_i1.p1  ORF type:complete len:201 (-),score=16.02 TRINITY_DN6802_c0_g1_i1:176-778(-)